MGWGAATPFVGRAGGWGGLGFLPRGIAALSLSEPVLKANRSFERFFLGELGGVGLRLGWGGGGLARWWWTHR